MNIINKFIPKLSKYKLPNSDIPAFLNYREALLIIFTLSSSELIQQKFCGFRYIVHNNKLFYQ